MVTDEAAVLVSVKTTGPFFLPGMYMFGVFTTCLPPMIGGSLCSLPQSN
jgi:hypothetical protein